MPIGPFTRIGKKGRELVTTLAKDAATGLRVGLTEQRQDVEEPGWRAERLVEGAARGLADDEVRRNLDETTERVGEHFGRGVVRGASRELARIALSFSPAFRPVLVASAIGLGFLVLLRATRR